MNSLLKLCVVGAVASFAVAQPAISQTKIGYVDSRKIMEDAPGRAEAEAEFDKELGKVRAEMQKLQDSLYKLAEQFDKEVQTLDSATAAKRAGGLQSFKADIEKKSQERQAELQEKEAALSAPLMKHVSTVLDEIRAKNGMSYIFDVASQAIVSADSTLNLTDQVIARLKELGIPKKTAAAPAPAGPAARPSGVSRPR